MSLSKRISDNQVVILVVLVLSFLDLLLLERKFGLFSGGFLLPERVGTPWARFVFGSTVFALEAGLAGCFWYLFHIVGLMRGAALAMTRYLFVVLYGGGSVVGIVAKYQILSYFGDFLSIAMVRNLGGGSLSGALGYGAVEFMKFGAWLVPGIFGCWMVFNWLKKRFPAMRKPARPRAPCAVLACACWPASRSCSARQRPAMPMRRCAATCPRPRRMRWPTA
jgi:hypothetical protein